MAATYNSTTKKVKIHPKWNITNQKIYYKHCIESAHPNVVLCPNEGLFNTKNWDYQTKVVKSLR